MSGEMATRRIKSAANPGGWKECARGHKFRGPGPCPVCWPGRAAKRRNLKRRPS